MGIDRAMLEALVFAILGIIFFWLIAYRYIPSVQKEIQRMWRKAIGRWLKDKKPK